MLAGLVDFENVHALNMLKLFRFGDDKQIVYILMASKIKMETVLGRSQHWYHRTNTIKWFCGENK